MPGRTSRVSLPPMASDIRRLHRDPKRVGRPESPPPAAGSAEPMTPRSSDEEAERPRFVSPSEAKKAESKRKRPKKS
jgi:hypothetical protein